MKKWLWVLIAFMFCTPFAWAQSGKPVKVIHAKKTDISRPLRDLAKEYKAKHGGARTREIPNRPSPFEKANTAKDLTHPRDAALQTSQPGQAAAASVLQSFEGISNADNASVLGSRVAPPDANMDVGRNHVVQMVNLLFMIWDKQGNILMGPTPNDALWSGFGGPCEFNNDGDPIVLYDPIADRWILSQFVFDQSQCIACSQTSDPTGAYYRYEFSTPGNDYPKLGVMPDAYYATIRNFSGSFNMDAVALERAKILTGDPTAKMVVFNMSALLSNIDGFLPADLDGPAPASPVPGYFMGHQDASDRLAIFEMMVDWNNVNNSTLTGPTLIPVAAFDGNLNNIPQPKPGSSLDPLTFAMMFRLGFRDMGTYYAMVANHTVDVNDRKNHAGIRWYELRNSGSGWSLYQQGTYAPDSDHRWMGSIAMNGNGDIGLGYSVSSRSTYPSIRFTGRKSGDPLGQMTVAEQTIIAGTGSQTQTSRWGDYSDLVVDPVDDATFWYTQEYVQTTGAYNWWTRIGAFQLQGGGGGGTPTSVHVESIVTGTQGAGHGQKRGKATVTIFDDLGGPVAGAVVTGTFSGTFNETQSGTTGADGTVVLLTSATAKGKVSVSFCVNDVVASLPYNPNDNASPAYACPAAMVTTDPLAPHTAELTDRLAGVPDRFKLSQNYPNPFNPTTSIAYDLPEAAFVKLAVYNALGEQVLVLVNRQQAAGSYRAQFNASELPSGVYLYRLEANNFVAMKKMVLTR